MASSADLLIRIITDTSKMKGLDTAAGKTGKMQRGLQKMAAPAAVALAGIVAFGKGAVDAASRTQQAIGAVDSVFGKNAGKVKAWAASAAGDVGLAKSEYMELASVVGAQLKNMGVPLDQVAGKTNDLVGLGADLAATYGGTTKQAVEALGSALRGETDPIERYGVSVKAADVAAQQAKDGTEGLTGAAGKQAKTMALLALVNQQTADASGQFAEEQGTAAVQAQIAAANYENMKSTLGTALLPIITKVMGVLAQMAKWIEKNSTATQIIVGVIAAFAAAILVLNVAMSIYTAITTLAAAATWATLLPILAVVAGVALLAVGFVLLWKKSKTFRTVVTAVWKGVKAAAVAVARVVKAAWTALWSALTKTGRNYLNAARAVFSAIRSVASAVASTVRGIWNRVWDALKTAVRTVTGVAKTAFNGIKTAVGFAVGKVQDLIGKIRGISVPGAIKSAFDAIKSAADKVIGVIEDIISALRNIPTPDINWPSPPKWFDKVMPGMALPGPAPAVAAARAPGVTTTGLGRSSSSAPIQINVQGALDPDAVARQIGRLLAGHDRRTGSGGLRRTSVVVN